LRYDYKKKKKIPQQIKDFKIKNKNIGETNLTAQKNKN